MLRQPTPLQAWQIKTNITITEHLYKKLPGAESFEEHLSRVFHDTIFQFCRRDLNFESQGNDTES